MSNYLNLKNKSLILRKKVLPTMFRLFNVFYEQSNFKI